jgi:hypothetical protein
VVIEYCWNGDTAQQQLSTMHDMSRYHEEATLTAAYIRRVCPDAVVEMVTSNFRGRPGRNEIKRLGAFEVLHTPSCCVHHTTCTPWSHHSARCTFTRTITL